MKNNKLQKISISVSREHEKCLPDITAAFGDFKVEYVGGLMRFSAQEMAMQVMIFLTTAFVGGAAWDLLKIGIKKLLNKFPQAYITIRGNDSIMYSVKPDLTINVIVVPERAKEFEHIKSLDDLIMHLQDNKKAVQKNIPDGWIKKHLGDVCSFANGKAHENNIVEGGKYIVVNSKFVSSNCLIYKTTNESLSLLSQGDVAMVMSDIPNGKAIAKCYLIKENNKFTLNQRIGVLRSKQIDSNFLYYLLNRNKYFLSFDDGVNQTNLRKDDILSCPLIFPLLPEQKRIVSALEAWDHTIEKLAKKIKIKKNIKKGLMKNLLMGEIRLPGFRGEWEIMRLGDIAKMSSGGTPKSTTPEYYGGDIPWVSIADMTKNGKYLLKTEKNLTKSGLENSAAKIYSGGTILYAMYASIGECSIAGVEMSSSQAILGISPSKNKLDSIFLYFYLVLLKEKIKLQGQQGTQSNLNAGMVRDFKIKLPKVDEQLAIVGILNAADNEIDMLDKKLSILKNQKKYLLNNLITGTIRTKA